jgi:uncharacterized membrane protein YraQ (UPF0718 family)
MQQTRPDPPLVDRMTIVFLALAAIGGTILWLRRGGDAVATVIADGAGLLALVLPVVALAVIVAAYVQRLLPDELVERWLGGSSGVRGLALGTAAGALTPGGPFAAFPVVLGLFRAGASRPVCIAYLTSWSVLGLQRMLVWELPFFGVEFALLRWLASLPLPFIAGALTASVLDRIGARH